MRVQTRSEILPEKAGIVRLLLSVPYKTSPLALNPFYMIEGDALIHYDEGRSVESPAFYVEVNEDK